jgi:hypothetical protein
MNDIVTHLRNSACGNDCRCAYCVRNKIAADEIEQLRELLGVTERLLTSERDEALRERNEARLEVCAMSFDDPKRTAEDRGWDCFAELNGAQSSRIETESKLIRHTELVDFVIKEASGLIIANVSANKTSAYWNAVTTLRRFEGTL